MKRKRILAALILLCVLLTVFPLPASAASLTIESITVNPPEIYLNDVITWTVNATGGTAPYTYEYYISKKPIDRTIYFLIPDSQLTTTSNVYEYAFTIEDVHYRFNVTVTDAKGKKVSTTAGLYQPKGGLGSKIKEIVAECAYDGLSDYEKAYNLYDWLCVNAEYDHTYTWYSPAGVLLHGIGVCSSFARAYKMLLDEVGIECAYVHGTADYSGGNHGWVMVKLDGEWYHMDPTWDEAYDFKCYFGLNTELIERDHTSEYIYDHDTLEEDYDIPITTADKYNYAMNHADIVFSDVSELNAQFDKLPISQRTIYLYCTGTVSNAQFKSWFSENYKTYRLNSSYSLRGSSDAAALFTLTRSIALTLPDDLKEIEAEAFAGDTSLSSVYISGDQLTTIGSRAFAGCTGLTEITVPDSVTNIADDAFEGCDTSMIIHCKRNSSVSDWFTAHGFYFRSYTD